MLIFYVLIIIIIWIVYLFANLSLYISKKVKTNLLLDNLNSKQQLLYMKQKDYENIIAEMFRRKGYRVKLTDRFGDGDNGLILNNAYYVLIKKYPFHHTADVEDARKINRFMKKDSIYRGMFITLGDFKASAKRYCFTNVISCINGDQLLKMCKEVQGLNKYPGFDIINNPAQLQSRNTGTRI